MVLEQNEGWYPIEEVKYLGSMHLKITNDTADHKIVNTLDPFYN